MHAAVRNPRRLAFSVTPDGALMLSAGAGADRLEIVASRERWAEVFEQAMTGRLRDPAATARAMFIRDEIDVAEFERALGAI
jgi:hypothetical protein